MRKYPVLQYSFERQEAEMAKSVGSLKLNFVFSLLVIYCLLVTLFQGYILLLIVTINLLSMVALSGGGINDMPWCRLEHATHLRRKQGSG